MDVDGFIVLNEDKIKLINNKFQITSIKVLSGLRCL